MKSIAPILALCAALHSNDTLAQDVRGTAFVNVNVVPMDRLRVLQNQTVLVRDGSIEELGPASVTAVPADFERVDGRGTAYLLPGLADMHTHVFDEADLSLYTVNGVTTILHMGGAPAAFVANSNQSIDDGSVVGPRIFFSLLVDGTDGVSGTLVSTPEQAHDAVERARDKGYHFIKVYNSLSAESFSAIVDEARQNGLSVIGHGVRAVGLPEGLFEGQVMAAHAEEFFYTAFNYQPNHALIPMVVSATFDSGAFVIPNLSTFEIISKQWGKPEVVADLLRDPRAQLMTPVIRQEWAEKDYVAREGGIESILQFLRDFTKALQEAGVPLMTGSDSPAIPGMYPGFSIHDDLRTLIEAGLTEYQALAAATRTPGEFIIEYVPMADRFGVVEIGMNADLVLVSSNPLEDIETLQSPLGVMSAGRWYSETELEGILTAHGANPR